ncbi:hypothetical protein B0H14DRAFT_3775594 [Mycena olivaceomarginata]|nr:hypothetical protein B0H14DRAFT_3775594 [Mycena olivaceomarginata]
MLQAVYYFLKFKDDDWRLKTLVTVAFVIDTVSNSDLAYLSKANWAIPLYIICTSCVAILVQSFLAFRYWRLTNNTILVVLLFMLILVAFGGTFISGLGGRTFPPPTRTRCTNIETHFTESICRVWLVAQVSVDVIIAGALVYEFQKAKSRFLKGRRRIHDTLNRLVVLTIQTGSATALIAVAAAITFLINDETNIPTGVMYSVGRVYVLSMLLNLNIRASANEKSTQDTSRIATSGRDPGTIAFAHDAGTSHADDLGGVEFRSATVLIDSRQDSNGTFQSISTQSHTAEIEMTVTNSSKKQSESLLV